MKFKRDQGLQRRQTLLKLAARNATFGELGRFTNAAKAGSLLEELEYRTKKVELTKLPDNLICIEAFQHIRFTNCASAVDQANAIQEPLNNIVGRCIYNTGRIVGLSEAYVSHNYRTKTNSP